MNELHSKKHFFNFYCSIAIQIFLCFGIGAFCFYGYLDKTSNNNDIKLLFWPFIGTALIFFGFYIIFDYTRKTKNIVFKENVILFGDDKFIVSDILKVNFFDKSFLINFKELNRPATIITFKNKKQIIIYDFAYSNILELKKYIQNVYLEQNLKIEPKDLPVESLSENIVLIHKGNLFISGDFIFLLGFQIFFGWLLFMSIKDSKMEIWFVLSFLWLYLTFHFAKMLYFFETTKTQLIIKNHILFWVNKKYLLKDIQNVSYENYYRRPQALRIVLNNFKTNEFYGGSLNSKNWTNLTKALKGANIEVN